MTIHWLNGSYKIHARYFEKSTQWPLHVSSPLAARATRFPAPLQHAKFKHNLLFSSRVASTASGRPHKS